MMRKEYLLVLEDEKFLIHLFSLIATKSTEYVNNLWLQKINIILNLFLVKMVY